MALSWFRHEYRVVVLILATFGLSLLLANVLTFSFTILCMTAEQFRWSNFNLNFGTDIFHSVDFDPPYRRATLAADGEYDRPPAALPNFEVPGVRAPAIGYNWQSYMLARNNFPLFIRYLQRAAKETSWRAARRANRAYDPRAVDFRKLLNGFSLIDYEPSIVHEARVYVLRRVRSIQQQTAGLFDARDRRLPTWTEFMKPEDVELHNMTWNGVVSGRVRVVERPAEFPFTKLERAALFALPAMGALIAAFGVFQCEQSYGLRKTMLIVSAIDALVTALGPTAVALGFWPFALVRLGQGAALAVAFIALATVAHRWSRLEERGFFPGVLSAFVFVAPIITMPIAGWSCAQANDWRLVFYIHAAATACFALLWWLGYRNTPVEHSCVTIHEQRRIESGKVVDARAKHSSVPAKQIRTSSAIIAVWIAAFGSCGVTLTLIMFAPTYFHHTLRFPLITVGLLCALPVGLLVHLAATFASDRLLARTFDETQRVRLFALLAALTQALALLLLAVRIADGKSGATLSVALYTAAIAAHGFNSAGVYKSVCVVAAQYGGFLNAHTQAIVSAALLIMLPIVVVLTPSNAHDEWSVVFGALAAIAALCGVYFALRGSGEPVIVSAFEAERRQRLQNSAAATAIASHSPSPAVIVA